MVLVMWTDNVHDVICVWNIMYQLQQQLGDDTDIEQFSAVAEATLSSACLFIVLVVVVPGIYGLGVLPEHYMYPLQVSLLYTTLIIWSRVRIVFIKLSSFSTIR